MSKSRQIYELQREVYHLKEALQQQNQRIDLIREVMDETNEKVELIEEVLEIEA